MMRRVTTMIPAIGMFGVLAVMLLGCTSVPSGVQPVGEFELERYLGTWYEIARLDHRFERGLSNISATYTRRSDGGIDVRNRGLDDASGQWREALGRGYFLGDARTASLKVTFFWPFYGGYHLLALDHDAYRYALVSGPSRDYLWILARERQLAPDVLSGLVATARTAGFNTDALIYVTHDRADPPAPR